MKKKKACKTTINTEGPNADVSNVLKYERKREREKRIEVADATNSVRKRVAPHEGERESHRHTKPSLFSLRTVSHHRSPMSHFAC